MVSMRGALAAVMLALVLAPAAMAQKPDETIAKDFAAFDKALEGLDPAIREKIDTATLQLLLDTLKLAQNAKKDGTDAVASITSSGKPAASSADMKATSNEEAVTETEEEEEEDATDDEAAVLTDNDEESAEEVESEAEQEAEEQENEEEEEEEAEENPTTTTTTKPKARSGASSQSSTIAKWQQCGGKGGECHKLGACDDKEFSSKCESGTSCKRHSEWYWQCMPSSTGSGSGQESVAKPSITQLNKWSQCGGKGGNCKEFSCLDGQYPNTACPDGNRCVRMNEWYHQCL